MDEKLPLPALHASKYPMASAAPVRHRRVYQVSFTPDSESVAAESDVTDPCVLMHVGLRTLSSQEDPLRPGVR